MPGISGRAASPVAPGKILKYACSQVQPYSVASWTLNVAFESVRHHGPGHPGWRAAEQSVIMGARCGMLCVLCRGAWIPGLGAREPLKDSEGEGR